MLDSGKCPYKAKQELILEVGDQNLEIRFNGPIGNLFNPILFSSRIVSLEI